jgi:ABC-2 type transport system ATP-binding protein
VGVVDQGRLVLEDALDSVRGTTGRLEVRTPDPDAAARLLGPGVVERRGDLLVVDATRGGPSALARHLVEHGVPLDGLAEQRRSLEDVVVAMTGPGSDSARTPAGGVRR